MERKVFEFFFYFIFGIVAGLNKEKLKYLITRYRWLLLGISVISYFGAVIEAELVFQAAEILWRSRTLTLPSAFFSISFIIYSGMARVAFEKLEGFNESLQIHYARNLLEGLKAFGVPFEYSGELSNDYQRVLLGLDFVNFNTFSGKYEYMTCWRF